MVEKIIEKPKDYPVNPYIGIKYNGIFEKLIAFPLMQVIEDRDQQILREIKKQSEINHNSYWSNKISYPKVPFDPFFVAIKKRDKQIKAYLLKKSHINYE